jgi:hypothetical protein
LDLDGMRRLWHPQNRLHPPKTIQFIPTMNAAALGLKRIREQKFVMEDLP